jgi:hypothetical protein
MYCLYPHSQIRTPECSLKRYLTKSVLGFNNLLVNPPDALNRRLTFQVSRFEVYCTSEYFKT